MLKTIYIWGLVLGLVLAVPKAMAETPPRVVSLDSCADQIVLRLADDGQILALSANATLPFSYSRELAKNYPSHNNSAEEILELNPDVALRTGVGGWDLAAMLTRLGVRQVATGLPNNLDEVARDVSIFANAMGQVERGQALLDEMAARLKLIKARAQNYHQLNALYLSPGGTTTGAGTFVGEVIALSGLSNMMAGEMPSWGQLDIEQLVLNPPDIIIGSFFDAQIGNADGWRFAKHPVVERLMKHALFINVPSRMLACPQWMMLDAIELIQKKLSETHYAAAR